MDDLLMQRVRDFAPPEPLSLPPVTMSAQDIVGRKLGSSVSVDDPMSVARNVTQLVDDPDLLTRTISAAGEHLEDVAPEAAQDLRNTTSRAIFFLASKAPKQTPSAPGMPPLPPPPRDVRRFERYIRAVNDPTSILDDADEGTLAPESVEAVKHVYPKLYEMMQTDLAGRVENMPKVPYKKKMQISALLGQDMAGTLNPAMYAAAQAVYGNVPQQQERAQMPVSRAKGLRVAERSAEYDTTARRNAQIGARR